jgi:hypothetical protein
MDQLGYRSGVVYFACSHGVGSHTALAGLAGPFLLGPKLPFAGRAQAELGHEITGESENR